MKKRLQISIFGMFILSICFSQSPLLLLDYELRALEVIDPELKDHVEDRLFDRIHNPSTLVISISESGAVQFRLASESSHMDDLSGQYADDYEHLDSLSSLQVFKIASEGIKAKRSGSVTKVNFLREYLPLVQSKDYKLAGYFGSYISDLSQEEKTSLFADNETELVSSFTYAMEKHNENEKETLSIIASGLPGQQIQINSFKPLHGYRSISGTIATPSNTNNSTIIFKWNDPARVEPYNIYLKLTKPEGADWGTTLPSLTPGTKVLNISDLAAIREAGIEINSYYMTSGSKPNVNTLSTFDFGT